MASPSALVAVIAHITGTPIPTVTDIDRRLVKAGLRTIGGRGLHAAQVTTLDAARLLTAVLGSAQANASAEAVARYEKTRADTERSSAGLFEGSSLRDLLSLTDQHSFVDGLAALITSSLGGSLAQLRSDPGEARHPRIELVALTRATSATLRITGLPNRSTISIEYRPVAEAHQDSGSAGDLEQYRRVTERTVYAVAELLREDQTHD